MGPPQAWRLASRGSPGKAVSEVADGKGAEPPCGRNCCKGLENEAAAGEILVRNGESPRAQPASAPQRNVQVEHARSPGPAGTAAEFALNGLEATQHLARVELALDQRH